MNGTERWNSEWSARQVSEDIAMRDFFGDRSFVLKYFPWWGKGLEAGCGLGRYIFYLTSLGREVKGLDFSHECIQKAKTFASEHQYSPELFEIGDVENLPYPGGTFSYIISEGVLEHFPDGPSGAIHEAYRVLAPGGIFLITTPNKWSFQIIRWTIKLFIKRMIGLSNTTRPVSTNPDKSFFQYWYTQKEMLSFLKEAGFQILEKNYVGIHYVVFQRSVFSKFDQWLMRHLKILAKLENSCLRMFGSSSVIVGIKPGSVAHCFCCGKEYPWERLIRKPIVIPVCDSCRKAYAVEMGAFSKKTKSNFVMPAPSRQNLTCEFCNSQFTPHPLFNDYGFRKEVCPSCIQIDSVRNTLCSTDVELVWRPYS